jgi:predicted porin
MKKLLVVLMLALGMPVLSHAQSSVTIYGVLDVGYSGKNLKGSPETASNTQTTNQIGNSYEIPSRLGFRGTEDLGGGTNAFFTIETGINANNSAVSTLINRQTFVGLGKRGLGQFAIGTQYGPIFTNMIPTDAGAVNIVIGSVISPAQGTDGGQSASDAAYTARFNNAITFKTEKIKGFDAMALYSMNNRDATQTGPSTGGTNNATAWGLGANYNWKQVLATVNYQSIKNLTTGATPSVSTSSTGTVSGGGINYVSGFTVTNGIDNQLYAALVYDFKIFKAYLNYTDRQITSALNSNEQLNRTGQQIGVRGWYTPQIEGWATVGNGRWQAYGVNNPTANFTSYQVGANYWLSKRTGLYAIFGSSQTSSTSAGSASGNQYALGMRHSF